MTKDDKSMPQKICTLCITYLKHAVSFRKQVIHNNRSLRQSAFSNSNYASGFAEPFNMKMLMQDDDDGLNGDWNDMNLAPESDTFDNLKLEIEQAFGGECDDSDDDEDDPDASVLFNYKEKSFKEDDISNFDSNIVITIPDEMRERKCDACRQRFMLKESFEQHLKECIELKLNKFVTEGYQLLSMRKSRALSANEFVRRMIFALKKVVKSLASCHKEVTDGPVIDDKLTKKMNLFDLTVDTVKAKKPLNNGIDPTQLSSIPLPSNSSFGGTDETDQNNRHLLNLLEGKPNVCIQKNFLESNQATAIDPTEIYLSKNRESVNHSKAKDENDSRSFSPKPSTAPMRTKQRRPPIETTVIVAQCSQCCESFSSLQQFEEHIRNFHNSRATSSPINGVSYIAFHSLKIPFLNFLFFFSFPGNISDCMPVSDES